MLGTAVLPSDEVRPAAPALRFLLVGMASAGTDVALLAALHGLAGMPLLAATTLAFWASLAVNFALNRGWVFPGGSGSVRGQAARYLFLVGVNYLATLALVGGLAAAGVPYMLAKVVALVSIACWNFVLYRRWIFA
jgi:putative flippase GtrA